MTKQGEVELKQVSLNNKAYFKISNSNNIRPFFMSIVSDSNHWMFISSNGGLTAGRKNSEFALFPYYSDDKITESAEITGSKSIFQIEKNGKKYVWEPFSLRSNKTFKTQNNLYKGVYGNSLIFEEINLDLNLKYTYEWSSSNIYGFVRTSTITNTSKTEVKLNILDGIQNVLPYGVGSAIQNASSNLVDAYKRTELLENSAIGIFALSAIIVDKAEPSEALKANIAWHIGFKNPKILLSSMQLNAFRNFNSVNQEYDIKAEKGAYFLNSEIILNDSESKSWRIIANVNQTQSDIVDISKSITEDSELNTKIQSDIDLGLEQLIKLNAASDGILLTSDNLRDTRHFSNTLFNIMRGGIFDNNYKIEKWDFIQYLKNANATLSDSFSEQINQLKKTFTLFELKQLAEDTKNKDFIRLSFEYLPLKFSRRHGDPSRPWNKFSINTVNEVDGSKILDYEGNWRDIFQNWEALAYAYPDFIESMIYKFLNATTFDGYNPYRVTKGGFDWETIEPDDPWSYIGYWGDHQIIYLLKFLEFLNNYNPKRLKDLFNKDVFVYANVPYKIKSYQDILKDPKDTIEFNEASDKKIRLQRDIIGADGALLNYKNNTVIRVNFIEKILATTLAKISNFIPEAGIWMNTQRPEWNDANNALVGNGVSMVTLYYLRRFIKFFESIFEEVNEHLEVSITTEVAALFNKMSSTLAHHKNLVGSNISDKDRKKVMDDLGEMASKFRVQIYENSFSGEKETIKIKDLSFFSKTVLAHLEHAIKVNKREDGIYHAYNLITINKNNSVTVSYLDEMLEGQVAVLSSGSLSVKQSLDVLDGLKKSKLFREDQYSYILYPFKKLKGFMDRNTIPAELVKSSKLLNELINTTEKSIIEKDSNGDVHFNGNFKNANDLLAALNKLETNQYTSLTSFEKENILSVFEKVFNHKAFTGRSGTFYGYEGLGSIYWHMVSKLQLAVMEVCQRAISSNASPEVLGRLLEHYYEINEGIGVHKTPKLYGAFPTDPYSHTPAGKGAQQPGMTGQVKEDILSRFGELGIVLNEGVLSFKPNMLRKDEFLKQPKEFKYYDLNGSLKSLTIDKDQLVFTYCQTPIIYELSESNKTKIEFNDSSIKEYNNLILDEATSKSIFLREGDVKTITVSIPKTMLK